MWKKGAQSPYQPQYVYHTSVEDFHRLEFRFVFSGPRSQLINLLGLKHISTVLRSGAYVYLILHGSARHGMAWRGVAFGRKKTLRKSCRGGFLLDILSRFIFCIAGVWRTEDILARRAVLHLVASLSSFGPALLLSPPPLVD